MSLVSNACRWWLIFSLNCCLVPLRTSLASVFDQIEPFAASLQRENGSRLRVRIAKSTRYSTLLVQHKIVGRVIDKPELL